MTALFSRIVVATDFSEAASHAMARATLLASEHGVPLEVIEIRGEGDDIARIAAHARPDVLLVVGGGGEIDLRDLFVGSLAERLLARVSGAVLVVKSAPVAPYRRVLAALDLADGSEQILEAALHAGPGTAVSAAHAYEVPFEGMLHRSGVGAEQIDRHRGEALRSAFERIEDLSRRIDPAQRIVALAERGNPAKVLVDRAAALEADLVVMGRRPRGAVERFFVGSVARHVVASAASDVLVVPQLASGGRDFAAPSLRASAARPSSR